MGGQYWSTSLYPYYVPYAVPYEVEYVVPAPVPDLSWDWVEPGTTRSLFERWADYIGKIIVQRSDLMSVVGLLQRRATTREMVGELYRATLRTFLTRRWLTPGDMVAELGGDLTEVGRRAALMYQEWIFGRMLLNAVGRTAPVL